MVDQKKILIIDDEVPIRRFLRASLDSGEFKVLEAADGESGIQSVAKLNPDVVLLDLGLPDMDGVDVTVSLREWTRVPIIVLSARGQEKDKVAALDAGADDYLTKPFGIGELAARIRVALRHVTGDQLADEPVIEFGQIRIDFRANLVYRNEHEVHLTANEYKLLAFLARHVGKVLTHRQLLSAVWGDAYITESHYLRVYIAQLRQKLEEDPSQPKHIITETGVGYRLRLDPV